MTLTDYMKEKYDNGASDTDEISTLVDQVQGRL